MIKKPADIKGALDTKNLFSEILNSKQQLVLKIEQSSDYVYPDEEFQYQIYCKNTSPHLIKDVHIQIISPENILINEDEYNEGVQLGDLPSQQSHLLKLKARCSTTGIFTIHFICYGEQTGLFTQKLTIHCDYDAYNAETIHRIHVYNFTPYEDTFMLEAQDYNEDVVRLRKIQKLPYGAGTNPFTIQAVNVNDSVYMDESQNYLEQKQILYDDPYNTDEHTYQYIERENFNKGSVEHFEGRNLLDVINQINDNSKIFKATFLKTGTNELLTDFKEYNANGFIYRFGLMSSELYHYLGVLPEYSYMSDLLFRWAPTNKQPLNLYPKKVALKWNTKKWAGHGWNVYKKYTDDYKQELINLNKYEPLFEFMGNFDNLTTAEEFIEKQYQFDTTNEYYTTIDSELIRLRKYEFIIQESFYDTGVFFVHIPLDKIPSNFFIPSTEEIEAIIQKTKPFGMKPLIRYISTVRFNHDMTFKAFTKVKTNNALHLGVYKDLKYYIQPYQYHNIIENVCGETRESLTLIPSGKGVYTGFNLDLDQNVDIYLDSPQNVRDIDIDMKVNTNGYCCSVANDLSKLSQLTSLLYQHNFESICFTIKNIDIHQISETTPQLEYIQKTDYQLWVESLKDDIHSAKWDVEIPNKNLGYYDSYYLSNSKDTNSHNINPEKGLFDFMEMPFTNSQLVQPNNESGIGFSDVSGKYHGISVEYNKELDLFDVKYSTSLNNTFKTHKHISTQLTGIAFKIIYQDSNPMVLFFIENKNEDNETEYQYFHHVIVPHLNSVFCFTRNKNNISSIGRWSNIIFTGQQSDAKVFFDTPRYLENFSQDMNNIIIDAPNTWSHINRIDKNEHSYAFQHNIEHNTEQVSSLKLHFDDIYIPDDAIIKKVYLRSIMETNTNKNIYSSIRNHDGFITNESSINHISLKPNNIESYPETNNNTQYYQKQYDIAVTNNLQDNIKYYANKIKENDIFNQSINLSVDYINDIDEFIQIKKPFWNELSEFTYDSYSFNDVDDCVFVIEGYNHGQEVQLISHLTSNNTEAPYTKTTIPTGYFKKYIHQQWFNQFMVEDTHIKFRFKQLNADIDIFNTYMNIGFKNKQTTNIAFNNFYDINIQDKKAIDIGVDIENIEAYELKNGFTIKIDFDDLEEGEYYRIYSMELVILYQAQSIDFLINNGYSEDDNNFISVSGQKNDAYMAGMFFNDMPSSYQYLSTANSQNLGIELFDTIYQSFVSEDDNITSVTLYPNGFVGNPDTNLKIGLYTNQKFTPGKLIKEINVSGWSKANNELNNVPMITYNFNVNNLQIGETYWLKIEVDKPNPNNYYLLKYIDSPQVDLKLLSKINNNLINNFGALKFQINSIHLYKSFNNIPISQDTYNNPNIFIGLYRGQGSIGNLKVKKYSGCPNE